MIEMMTEIKTLSPASHSHFHGNGNCDATREANKREDRQNGTKEITPYSTAVPPAQAYSAGAGGAEYMNAYDWEPGAEEGMSSIPQDSFNKPLNADEAARNSWRALLARNVGRNVLVRFLIGTQNMVTVEGELYEVGTDYLVIFQPLWDSHITADLYSVKFVEFREPPGELLN